MLVGAGTLLTPEQAQAACRAGASFGVAPGFDPRVVKAAAGMDCLGVPGVSKMWIRDRYRKEEKPSNGLLIKALIHGWKELPEDGREKI